MTKKSLRFVEYWSASHAPHVLVDATHAAPPMADWYTGEIASAVADHTGCHCIVATVSRTDADLNRPPQLSGNPKAIKEYRAVIARLLRSSRLLNSQGKLQTPFLHLAVHGMRDDRCLDVEVGTRDKTSCSPQVHDWIMEHLHNWASEFRGPHKPKVGANQRFRGDESKAYHRQGDGTSYRGFGPFSTQSS